MESDPNGRSARALRAYVREVAHAVGVGPEASWCQYDVPATAYLPLDGRLPGHPERDFALNWDERDGWAAVLDRGGADVTVLRYLGGDVLPKPVAVGEFVAELRAGRATGQPNRPNLRDPGQPDDLVERLEEYDQFW